MSLLEIGEAQSEAEGPGGMDGGAGRPLRADVWRRFRANRMAMVGLAFIVLLLLMAIFADFVAPYGFDERAGAPKELPSRDHWFGTDQSGRDLFSKVVYGARVSLRIGFLAAGVSIVVGGILGALAGFAGGLLDTVVMRTVDVVLAVPYMILAVAIATALDEVSVFGLFTIAGRSENAVILIIGLTQWTVMSRIVRATFLGLRQLEYVEAATALGYSRWRIMLRHMLPNALQPIIVYGTLSIGTVILTEAALSFLQVGPQHPTPAWGLMISRSKGLLPDAPHVVLVPGAAIFLTVLAFVFVGDGLRDALDPKLKGSS